MRNFKNLTIFLALYSGAMKLFSEAYKFGEQDEPEGTKNIAFSQGDNIYLLASPPYKASYICNDHWIPAYVNDAHFYDDSLRIPVDMLGMEIKAGFLNGSDAPLGLDIENTPWAPVLSYPPAQSYDLGRRGSITLNDTTLYMVWNQKIDTHFLAAFNKEMKKIIDPLLEKEETLNQQCIAQNNQHEKIAMVFLLAFGGIAGGFTIGGMVCCWKNRQRDLMFQQYDNYGSFEDQENQNDAGDGLETTQANQPQ